MAENAKPLRQAMPLVTAFIDELRAAFDVDGETPVADAIRKGMRGSCDFHASENGHEVGNRRPERGISVIPVVFDFNQAKAKR